MSSRDICHLHPDIRLKCVEFLCIAKEQGIDALITCTWRSSAEQDELYAQGRTKPGKIVTRARGGQSAHNFVLDGKPASKAFDFVPMLHGKCVWDTESELWQKLGAIGESLGLNWYGLPDAPFREFAHLELQK